MDGACPAPSKSIVVGSIGGSEYASECDHKGVCVVSTWPKELEERNLEATLALPALTDIFYGISPGDNETVSFMTRNPFNGTVDMYVRYQKQLDDYDEDKVVGIPTEDTCEATPYVEMCGAAENYIEASCIDPAFVHQDGEPYAVIEIYFVDSSNMLFPYEESATVHACCHPTGTEGASVVLYTFYIMCSCPSHSYDTESRAIDDGAVVTDDSTNKTPAPSISPAPSVSPTLSPSMAPSAEHER